MREFGHKVMHFYWIGQIFPSKKRYFVHTCRFFVQVIGLHQGYTGYLVEDVLLLPQFLECFAHDIVLFVGDAEVLCHCP